MRSVKHLVVGAGVHGLSMAVLAEAGEDVLVVDKTGVGAGAPASPAGWYETTTSNPR